MRHLKFYRRAAALAELHELGRTNKECRELLGINHNAIAALCRYLGIKLAYDMAGWDRTITSAQNRARKMAAMYRAGMTLQQIGEKYDVSRERVRQLIAKYEGMNGKDGGQHRKAAAKKQRAHAERDARYLDKYGCTFAEWNEVRALGSEMRSAGASNCQTPLRAFAQQRNHAKQRGIAWELKFWQWWTIWQESQKWEQRGRAKDAFVMCRFNDEGPYAAGNVFIGTLASNSAFQPNNPYRASHPDHDRFMSERSRRDDVRSAA